MQQLATSACVDNDIRLAPVSPTPRSHADEKDCDRRSAGDPRVYYYAMIVADDDDAMKTTSARGLRAWCGTMLRHYEVHLLLSALLAG